MVGEDTYQAYSIMDFSQPQDGTTGEFFDDFILLCFT
jgi:hypothetical protein